MLTIEIVLPPKPAPARRSALSGRLPRISRLMALAIKCDDLIRKKVVRDYQELALLGEISKPRVTQLMNLMLLAPDLQEYLLFLPPATTPRDRITERELRPVTRIVDWEEQRRVFDSTWKQSAAPEV